MKPSNPVKVEAQNDRELVLTREFDAPVELVWRAWTEPERIAMWWGPRGFATRVEAMDLRPGGVWRYVMVGPDGKEYPACGEFREVTPMRRIITADWFDEEFEYPADDLPKGLVTTVLFDDLGDRTRVTLRVEHATPEDRAKHEKMGVVEGWSSSLDRLAEHLAERLSDHGVEPGSGGVSG